MTEDEKIILMLAEWCSNSGFCPMPDNYLCEHRISDKCTCKNTRPDCWILAAKKAIKED